MQCDCISAETGGKTTSSINLGEHLADLSKCYSAPVSEGTSPKKYS